ncbi:MAG: helix-turn-helix domain-containing protein [Prevotellaceae bacterium]|nr:helix-turn-helix domain-containing protein [Prevotellaceae bacterium]
MTKCTRKSYRYSLCFKQKVVEELKSGISIRELSRKYGITGGDTVKKWVKQYGYPQLLNEVIYVKMRHETDELKALRKEVQRLKIALADKSLAYDALETLLEVAGIDRAALKKNTALPPLRDVVRSEGGA